MKIAFKIVLLVMVMSNVWAARLTDIQSTHADSKMHVELALTQPTQYHIFTLPHPDRLVLDLANTQLNTSLKKIALNDSVTNVRSGYPKPSTLRLVFDLNSAIQYQCHLESQTLVLDILEKGEKSKPTSPKPVLTSLKPTVVVPNMTRQPIVVVIDPGHGGKDTGAIGKGNTKEKDVVLAIARQLANLINRRSDMHAVLTRNGDYFVPLRERLKLARRGKADLFVAIHADSFLNNHSSGASVYALSHRGATSEAARWLASRENTSELGGVDLGELDDKSHVLRSVLIDLAQTATIRDSLRLGTSLLDSLDNITALHYTRVEQAPFVVLKSPDIPSVLVETGFISNPSEEAKLSDTRYQAKMANALFSGIQLYLKKYSSIGA